MTGGGGVPDVPGVCREESAPCPVLHLAQEVSSAVVLQAAGQDLTARVSYQQSVFELGRPLPVPGHRRPAVGPRLVLPAPCNSTRPLKEPMMSLTAAPLRRPFTFTYHRLDGEHMTGLHHSNCFVF